MNEQYWNSVKKRPSFGLESPTDMPDMLEQAAMTPEVDFTKSSFANQAPVGTKSFEDIGGVEDLSGPVESGVVESGKMSQKQFDVASRQEGGANQALNKTSGMNYKAGGTAAASTLAQGGSAKDAVATGLVATGNPWAIGAGLGLMTLSSIEKKKQQQKETEYKNKLAQVEARKSSIDRLAQIGQGMRA
jgi:hypothetical protein